MKTWKTYKTPTSPKINTYLIFVFKFKLKCLPASELIHIIYVKLYIIITAAHSDTNLIYMNFAGHYFYKKMCEYHVDALKHV